MRNCPLWIPAAAPSEGFCRRAAAAVPTSRTAAASRKCSWPPTRSVTTPRLPLHVPLAGAAPLAPAALLPVWEFAGISEADTYWSTRKQRLN